MGQKMILDFHCHIGRSRYEYRPGEFTPEDLIKRMDVSKVDVSCCFSFADVLDNDYVVNRTKPFDRLIAFAFVNPNQLDSAHELEQLAKAKAVRGLKLHPYLHGFHANNTILLDPIYEVCQAYELPIIYHMAADN